MLIELSEQDVQAILEVLINSTGSPWRITHPLIMKLGAQQQQAARDVQAPANKGNSHGDRTADPDRGRDLDPQWRTAPDRSV